MTLGIKEAPIQTAIEGWLRFQADIEAWRQNSGAVPMKSPKTGRTRKVRLAPAGSADLTGIIWPGVRLEIEVKSAKGTQSAAQRDFQAKVEALGGLYILARSVDDVIRAVERFRDDHPGDRPTHRNPVKPLPSLPRKHRSRRKKVRAL